jgi:hypothetical protein
MSWPHDAYISQNSRLLILAAFIRLNVLFGLVSNSFGGHPMTRAEFFEWLDTCPTHKWEVTHEEYGHVVISFPNEEEEDEEEDAA